ncbi:hypothetical protein LX69_00212 [Breznakibacter xylanolyticus]|uniref:Uncharacterized protein n=1 Tax=Breznakibacter xylanolyticus TaxID=990 RepID=A0A2W7NRV5_9BACT|nr:hypothetical protein [Breznakibacter xylanolyticus]PZX20787.1 hypothetical protein LX69_00212 [Breznakibacter xylanolyticus]
MAVPLYQSEDYWRQVHALGDELGMRLAGSSRVEARLMGLDVLPRLLVCLGSMSGQCAECKHYERELQVCVEQLPELVNPDNKTMQKKFEQLTMEILLHLKTEHSMQPKGKVFSRMVLWGMALGVATSAFVWLFMNDKSLMGLLLAGWLCGMMSGYVAGRITEMKMIRQNRLF